jgi:hypothetical protein
MNEKKTQAYLRLRVPEPFGLIAMLGLKHRYIAEKSFIQGFGLRGQQ